MHADRISLALTRIETAAARISRAARTESQADTGAADGTDTSAQYQALRRETASALEELDQLIARLEP